MALALKNAAETTRVRTCYAAVRPRRAPRVRKAAAEWRHWAGGLTLARGLEIGDGIQIAHIGGFPEIIHGLCAAAGLQ